MSGSSFPVSQNVLLSVSDSGRFEKPSSLNPKSSWLPARSNSYFDESRRSVTAGGITPVENTYSYLMSHSHSHSATKKSNLNEYSLNNNSKQYKTSSAGAGVTGGKK